jgi:hypothetical protein
MASVLESIIRDAKVAFVVAKLDGKLEASEVVQIAVQISQKIYALASVSSAEKDALVLLALKKGLAAADGLQGLAAMAGIPPAALEAAEEQILKAGVAAAGALRAAAPKLFAPAKKALLSCLPCCAEAIAVAEKLMPADAALIEQAVKGVRTDLSGNTVAASPESVAPTAVVQVRTVAEAPVENTPLPNTPAAEPNLVAFS